MLDNFLYLFQGDRTLIKWGGWGWGLSLDEHVLCIDLFLVTYYSVVQVMKPGIELPTCAQVLA